MKTNFYQALISSFCISNRLLLILFFLLLNGAQVKSQVKKSADPMAVSQYIVVYKRSTTERARTASNGTFKERQQLIRNRAQTTLLRNKLSGKTVTHVYGTALKGFAVSGLTGADLHQLRKDSEVAYIVPDQLIHLDSEANNLQPMAVNNCNGPSITLNGVPNYAIGLSAFGSTATVTGEVIVVNDGVGTVSDGCSAIQNNVTGKIALIDRGSCNFSDKAFLAQQAGAIGVIFANNTTGGAPSPGVGINANFVTIPCMALSLDDADALKIQLGSGSVTATLQQTVDPSTQCIPWGITRVGGGLSGAGKRAWIIDTGIDLTHPDLNVNASLSTHFAGSSVNDVIGHGTHVAGIIAAKDNNFGIIGVAAGAEVVAVRVFADDGTASTSALLDGINYVAANASPEDVVNMSLGGSPDEATEEAVIELSSICKVVVSAGNNFINANYQSPARINGPAIFTVSAIDMYDRMASFSNYGNDPIDYGAPGVNIASCWLNGGYTYNSGTSMAAPHVAGLLLLGQICATSKVIGDVDGRPDPIATLYNAANDKDEDHDGVTICGGDLDDSNPAIYPGATEVCDNLDNDCDGEIDEGNVCCPGGNTGRLYVNASASGAGTGLSWGDAFTSLQTALTSARLCSQITQIWVAKGTYYPQVDLNGNASPRDTRTKTFSLKNDLAIYGGFGGTEAADYDLSKRNFATNTTILSGNIQQNGSASDNAYNVILNFPAAGTTITSTAILDGFTIREGYTRYLIGTNLFFPLSYGAGMLNYASSPVIRNCIFSNNNSYRGGGMENWSSSPTISNSVFFANTAANVGGGVENVFSYPTLFNCTFIQNISSYGGGMSNYTFSTSEVTNCSFSGNSASMAGGAIYNYNGAVPLIKNSISWGNGSEIVNAASSGDVAPSNPTVDYSIIQGGWSGTGGNNRSDDPKFASQPAIGQTNSGDLRLVVSSPAVNGGDPGTTTGNAGLVDLDQLPRLFGGRIDIGAFELQEQSQPFDILYVKQGSSGAGYSWQSPFGNLADALKLAKTKTSVKQIRVAKGIYKPLYSPVDGNFGNADSYNNAFLLVKDVGIYGGFDPDNGIRTLEHSRISPTTNAGTILSGDLNNNDGIAVNSGQLVFTNYNDNAYQVVVSAGDVGSSTLDGLTIKSGSARINNVYSANGESINRQNGGGLSTKNSSPLIRNVLFYANSGTDGGGAYFAHSDSIKIFNSEFTANWASYGGGLFSYYANMKANEVNFTGNQTSVGGGAIYHSNADQIALNNSVFYGNISGSGGAIYNREASPIIKNTVFTGNGAGNGGAIYNFNQSRPVVLNGTFANNVTAVDGSVVYNDNTSSSKITNSILWDAGLEVVNGGDASDITHSIVRGGSNGEGNVFGDPLFVDSGHPAGADGVWRTTDDGLRLQSCSPAINSGSLDTLGLFLPLTDLQGLPRIAGSRIDRGAYESSKNLDLATLVSSYDSLARVQTSNGTTFYTDACNNLLASVTTQGAAIDVSGTTYAKVWIDATQSSEYVKRHFEITPAQHASTATGRVTLYFTQAEFGAFNAENSTKLPSGPSDTGGISKLVVEKRGGSSSDNSGNPSTYPGTTQIISEVDVNWNTDASRWEVSFAVTGFSGFFVKTESAPLPVRLITFEAKLNDNGQSVVSWKANELNAYRYEIERSKDAKNFHPVLEIASKGDGINDYQVTDPILVFGQTYYRMRQVDKDGTYSYSRIISVTGADRKELMAYPNPASDEVVVESTKSQTISLINTFGVILKEISVTRGENKLSLKDYSPGLYFFTSQEGQSIKVIKK